MLYLTCSASGGDLDDLWDFGTVRHVGRQSTIGRRDANQTLVNNVNHAPANASAVSSSPPRSRSNVLVNGNNHNINHSSAVPQAPRRTGSEISLQSSITAKGERLPPLPPSTPRTPTSPTSSIYDTQATIRHAEAPMPHKVVQQIEEDEEEDYGELLDPEPYPPMAPQHDNNRHLHDLPDTAMLDSVVLPAIASVGFVLPV